MKLFKFYPNDYCRMYVTGRDVSDVILRTEELFVQYLKDENPWIDLEDLDELDYIEDKRREFLLGLSNINEVTDGVAIDSHY